MSDIYFDCGSYEANRNMARHINAISGWNPAGTSVWDGRVYIDMDTLSRETPDVRRTILSIVSHFRPN